MYALETLKKKLALPASLIVQFPPSEIEADLAIPCFKSDPKKIAKKIKGLKLPLVEKIEITGKYVNLVLNKSLLAKNVITEIEKTKDKYGWSKNNKKTVLIEYSSPNIAKQMHIGHLRNTIIGNSLKNIYKALGYKTISANYIGDWGAHFGLLLAMNPQRLNNLPAYGKAYAKASLRSKQDSQFKEKAATLFKKLEDGDKDLVKLWKEIRNVSLKEFRKRYKELGVDFDLWNGESFYKDLAKKAIKEALEKEVAKKSDGAIAVDLEKYGLRSYLLQKSNGATLYAARDLAAAKWRLSKYKPEEILYVVGHEQELFLKQVFKTLELLGYPAKKLKHISYNLVTIGGKKVSARAGNTILVKDIFEKVAKKTTNKKIGIGAVIYNLLSQRRSKSIDFDWKKILNLQGDSASYLQYGYVRAQGILKKRGRTPSISPPSKGEIKWGLNKREENLVMMLAKYPEIISQARELNEPHLIAGYLNDLVQEFNRFYAQDPVITAESPAKEFRLGLVKSVAQVIKNGLGLLGIQVPKKM